MPIITLHARRWFHTALGNTYHSVTVEIDGIEMLNTGIHYGYGDQYIKTAYDCLVRLGYITDLSRAEFSRIHGNGFYVIDVPRKKDL